MFFSFCVISLTMICVLLLFSNTSCICSFCALVMFICFSDLPFLCLSSCFFGHFCLETCACYSAFKCLWPCIHRLCHSYSSACHWGYLQMHVRELLPNQHIWPLYYSRFLNVECYLDVVRNMTGMTGIWNCLPIVCCITVVLGEAAAKILTCW